MTTTIVVYCSRCDYLLKVAVAGPIGTHGCMQCHGGMEVYVPQELAAPDWTHQDPSDPPVVGRSESSSATGDVCGWC